MQNTAIQDYHAARQPNDIDLIAEVRQRLVISGISAERIMAYEQNQYIIDACDKTPEVQRFLLNRYWNLQLMSSRKVSINERYCLIPNGSIDDWLRLFSDKILPFIVKNELPALQ